MSNEAEIVEALRLSDGSSPSGCMLIERVLQQLLQAAFAALKADPSTIDDLFYKVSSAERVSIKNWLSKLDVVVRTGYPEVGFTKPLITIVTEAEDEQAPMDFLGDQMGQEGLSEDGTQAYYTVGHVERCQYNLMCFAGKDANVVLYLYHLVKAILLLNMPLLQNHGLIAPTVTGRDLSFRDDMLPEFVYCRVVSLSCHQVYGLYVTERLATSLVVQTLPITSVGVQVTV